MTTSSAHLTSSSTETTVTLSIAESATTGTTETQPQRRVRVTSVPLSLAGLSAPQATAESRAEQRKRMLSALAEAATTEPLAANERLYSRALYYGTMLPPSDEARTVTRRALQAYESTPDEEFQRMTLEAAYGVDSYAFLAEMSRIAEVTSSPKHFAMATLYLVRALPNESGARRDAMERLARKFPEWEQDPILTMLTYDLIRAARDETAPISAAGKANSRPPLSTLLSQSFAPGFPVVYTLQRPERSWPGLALVRRPDGRFHRNPDGTLFRISHLARSRTNLPGYITNGNTPQGIFTITGLGKSRSQAIGTTPYLHTFLPGEISPDRFFHNPALQGTTWTLEMYRQMLPEAETTGPAASMASWRNDLPIWTAWYAGQAGRFDILSHGTTVDPSLYTGKSWFPGTPTSGCICAKEIWDEATGEALHSDQLALVHAYLRAAGVQLPEAGSGTEEIAVTDGPKGFFVLIELEDKPQPVTLDEVLTEVLRAER